jgi:mRNA-degrading endonuclease RelE of RelBE toxin-antitoxin system
MPQYQICFCNHGIEKAWASLEEQMQDKIDDLKRFLQENPKDRLKSAGKLKKMKGRLKGVLQYDITVSHRVRYEVDSSEKVVLIRYIGSHPSSYP